MTISTLEIRNYLLKPDMLEHFIDYFEAHFLASQEAEGMFVLGQFRPHGQPERFVWIRGFADMAARQTGLSQFYSGAVWNKYKQRANEMMLEFHNVQLVRPISDIEDLTAGMTTARVAAELDAGTVSPEVGVIALDFYKALPYNQPALVGEFQEKVLPLYEQAGIQVRGEFVADMSENTFKNLPVIQDANQFIVVTAYADEAAYTAQRAQVAVPSQAALSAVLSAPPETLLLHPTLRSPLRYRV